MSPLGLSLFPMHSNGQISSGKWRNLGLFWKSGFGELYVVISEFDLLTHLFKNNFKNVVSVQHFQKVDKFVGVGS